MCPLGVSNDRISSALARAENRASISCEMDGADATEALTALLRVFRAAIAELFREVEAQQKKAQKLQAENRKLRGTQERILAQHSSEIAKAVAEARREAQE